MSLSSCNHHTPVSFGKFESPAMVVDLEFPAYTSLPPFYSCTAVFVSECLIHTLHCTGSIHSKASIHNRGHQGCRDCVQHTTQHPLRHTAQNKFLCWSTVPYNWHWLLPSGLYTAAVGSVFLVHRHDHIHSTLTRRSYGKYHVPCRQSAGLHIPFRRRVGGSNTIVPSVSLMHQSHRRRVIEDRLDCWS